MKKYITILILTFCCAIVHAQDNSYITAEKIPFKLFNNYIYLHIRINHSKLVWFLLDTGSGTIIDMQLAKDLKLSLSSFQKTLGVGSGSDDAAIAKKASFQIEGQNFTEEKIAVVALKGVEECANKITVDTAGKVTMQETAMENPDQYQHIDGVLGANFFKTFVVEIDFEQQFLTLYDPKTYHYQGNGKIVPIEVTGSHIFLNASVKRSGGTNINGRFMIDTGSPLAVVLNTPFIEKNNLLPPPDQTVPLSLCGIGGSSTAQIGHVPGLLIQHIDINNPSAMFSQATSGVLASTEFDGTIGTAIFRHFKVIFDYSNNQMILE